jgi:hypothetical protein
VTLDWFLWLDEAVKTVTREKQKQKETATRRGR